MDTHLCIHHLLSTVPRTSWIRRYIKLLGSYLYHTVLHQEAWWTTRRAWEISVISYEFDTYWTPLSTFHYNILFHQLSLESHLLLLYHSQLTLFIHYDLFFPIRSPKGLVRRTLYIYTSRILLFCAQRETHLSLLSIDKIHSIAQASTRLHVCSNLERRQLWVEIIVVVFGPSNHLIGHN